LLRKDAAHGTVDQIVASGTEILEALIALELRRRRRAAHLSPTDLERLADLGPGQVSDYESGRAELEAATLWRLCRALGTDVAGFFDAIRPNLAHGDASQPAPRQPATALSLASD
jgi:transcriptional regulator with XRE-family HTH domain